MKKIFLIEQNLLSLYFDEGEGIVGDEYDLEELENVGINDDYILRWRIA